MTAFLSGGMSFAVSTLGFWSSAAAVAAALSAGPSANPARMGPIDGAATLTSQPSSAKKRWSATSLVKAYSSGSNAVRTPSMRSLTKSAIGADDYGDTLTATPMGSVS